MSDNVCLLQDGVCISEDSTGAIETDKQFMDIYLSGELNKPIPAGTIVRATLKGNTNICIITKEYTKGNGTQGNQVSPRNDLQQSTVDRSDIELISSDPVDIPHSSQDLDPTVVKTCLIEEDLHKLWDCTIDDTVS